MRIGTKLLPKYLSVIAISLLVLGCARTTTPRANYGPGVTKSKDDKSKKGKAKATTFKNLDADADGKLSVDEFVGTRERTKMADIFALSDKDGDGFLNAEEFEHKPLAAVFRGIDADGDGALDVKEFFIAEMSKSTSQQAETVFASVDRNSDHRISLEEYETRSPETDFAIADSDHNGGLSKDEFQERFKRMGPNVFKKWDADSNGVLTCDEFLARGTIKAPKTWQADHAFNNLDTNQDGQLTIIEFATNQDSTEAVRKGKIFAVSDVNKDGCLSVDEYNKKPLEARFLLLDRDLDEYLTLEEFAAPSKTDSQLQSAKKDFAIKDVSRDGTLTWDEFADRVPEGAFNRLDIDRDGRLTATEFTANSEGDQTRRKEKIFAVSDMNHDSYLSVEEYNKKPLEARFLLLDRNLDENLTMEEFTSQSKSDSQLQAAKKDFAAKDASRDGTVTWDEFANRVAAAAFKKLDRDRDGRLTATEFTANSEGDQTRRKEKIFAVSDMNHDSYLSVEEYNKKPLEARFLLLDRNLDESLTMEEFTSLAKNDNQLQTAQVDFANKDTSRDGTLTWYEFAYRVADQTFWDTDENDDLLITMQEFERANLKRIAMAEGADRQDDGKEIESSAARSAVFNRIDINHDGKVSLAEYRAQSIPDKFWWFDWSGDSALDEPEFAAYYRGINGMGDAKDVFKTSDVDKNRKLSIDEVSHISPSGASTE